MPRHETQGAGLHRINRKLAPQIGQKTALGIALLPVSIAHAHGHFVDELAVVEVDALLHCGIKLEALEQHVVIKPREIERA